MKMKCIIVDDEPLARKGIQENLDELDYCELVGIAENAVQALVLLEKTEVDLMFLDINMPKITGLDFLKNLPCKPMVIIISAYAEHALDGFNLDVLDYLVKPVPFVRFVKAVKKARDYYALKHGTEITSKTDYFFIKSENKYEKIFLDEILYVEAADNYVSIHTSHKRHLTYVTIKIVEENLPKDLFVKVHKSFIVPLSKIKNIEGNEIHIGIAKIPVSRGMRNEVMERVVNKNLLKRKKN